MSRDFAPAPTAVPASVQIARLEAEVESLAYELEVAREAAAHWQVRYHRAKDELATAAILADQRGAA